MTHRHRLEQPLRWRKPRMVFVCSMGDLFHEDVPDEFIASVFGVMARARHHTFQVLTKRPNRLRQIVGEWERDGLTLSEGCTGMIPPNVWVGTSASTQKDLDANVPHLLSTPASVRFLSLEPLLGPMSVSAYLPPYGEPDEPIETTATSALLLQSPYVNWVIVGGESGPGARPMHPQWARNIRDQCISAGVPFFFKQWGEWLPGPVAMQEAHAHRLRMLEWQDGCLTSRVGKKRAGRELDGRTWDEMPEVR
jgi:protein gp37